MELLFADEGARGYCVVHSVRRQHNANNSSLA